MTDDARDKGSPAASAWSRLEDQLTWYDDKSLSCQRQFKWTKSAQLVLGAAIPVIALVNVAPAVTASIAACAVILEGIQQLNQWQANWILYRSTAESLKHEKSLFLAHAGPYASRARTRVLAERVEGLVSQEHAKWTVSREEHATETDSSPRG